MCKLRMFIVFIDHAATTIIIATIAIATRTIVGAIHVIATATNAKLTHTHRFDNRILLFFLHKSPIHMQDDGWAIAITGCK